MRSTGNWEWIWSAIELMASTFGVSGSWITVLVVVGIVGCIRDFDPKNLAPVL